MRALLKDAAQLGLDARRPPGAEGTPPWESKFLSWTDPNPLKSPESDEGFRLRRSAGGAARRAPFHPNGLGGPEFIGRAPER